MSAIGTPATSPPAQSTIDSGSVRGVLRRRWNVLVALALPLLLEARSKDFLSPILHLA